MSHPNTSSSSKINITTKIKKVLTRLKNVLESEKSELYMSRVNLYEYTNGGYFDNLKVKVLRSAMINGELTKEELDYLSKKIILQEENFVLVQ